MTVSLRVVWDRVDADAGVGPARATRDITRALVSGAPQGCDVEVIVPSIPVEDADQIASAMPGVGRITRLSLPRRELIKAWQWGLASGMGGGLVHAPTPIAPLIRHDRVHDHHQCVVTMWDMRPWESPEQFSRKERGVHAAFLARAVRYADAVVVPTHAAASFLAIHASLGERVRVIPGAAPTGFTVPTDDVGRRRDLGVPEGFVCVDGAAGREELVAAFRAISASGIDIPVVVMDAGTDQHALRGRAQESGLSPERVFACGSLTMLDRAAVLAAAVVFMAPSPATAYPWAVLEAMALGVPLLAADSPTHRDVILDGGLLYPAADIDAAAQGLEMILGSPAQGERWGVLSADRGRGFSWAGAAEKVWQLHADL